MPYWQGGRAYEPYAAGYFAAFAPMQWMFAGMLFSGALTDGGGGWDGNGDGGSDAGSDGGADGGGGDGGGDWSGGGGSDWGGSSDFGGGGDFGF